MKERKLPLRKCVITGEQHPKMEMFRVVREPDGNVVIDSTGKVRGHGVYLCKDETVIANAKKKKVLNRFLEVSVPDEIYDELIKLIKNQK